ncbi:LAME_0A02938g1_1 [Lachancea meyersii CBS 8951]|uniref:LAME_0A02938g1_1 n=1 Tax=Lachancea meyersii CBS 8951 TaxID=1266667 RepID=A0A1G4IMV9_9SACH|nr:LAME_0A02938g1_1 [Lachancea meyersii CBS 8951]
MTDFQNLVEKDAQIRYAFNAIRRYKSNEPSDADDEKKSRHKRNIIAVDDNLKINYEMVKTAPGTFIESSLSASKNKVSKEKAWKVAKTKTNYYKKRLSNMNEQFVAELEASGTNSASNAPNESLETSSASSVIDLASQEQQTQWLCELQKTLIEEYRALLQEEKKWFLKKEVLLDANVKLDLYATRDGGRDTELQLSTGEATEMCSFPV